MNLRQKWTFISIFFFACAIFLVHFYLVKTAVYGDGRYYYSYLPTFLIEHTFNFSSSFRVYGLPFIYTPTHFLQNAHTIGPAITWTIPYLLGFSAFRLLGNSNPYNVLLQIPIGICNIALVFGGLFFVYKSIEKYFSSQTSWLVSLIIFLATNLFFYGAIDVLNSHSASFFFAAAFVYFWLSKTSIQNSLLMGASLGMLILCRTQDAIFVLLPISTLLQNKKHLLSFSFMAVVAFVFLIPQSYLWHILWGNWLKNPYLYGATFDFIHPHVFGVLFNAGDGLFLWTPITFFAFLGLFIFIKNNLKIGISFILIFLLTLYLIASFEVWWAGASFSARYFISVLPLFAFGLAAFYEKFLSFRKQLLFSGIFVLLNVLLIFNFLLRS